jgi:hypothetical protein
MLGGYELDCLGPELEGSCLCGNEPSDSINDGKFLASMVILSGSQEGHYAMELVTLIIQRLGMDDGIIL